ncbi:hypothetical protein BGP_0011 [Beggiatoa sp. PS]|nr:hypothetical protein BGP_0011 [Beggiatoa sp. PS]
MLGTAIHDDEKYGLQKNQFVRNLGGFENLEGIYREQNFSG